MSMSSVLSALRAAGRKQLSASTIAARQASGSHVLRIDGYTQVTRMAAHKQVTASGKFSVGGHDWRVLCYPNGCYGHEGYISFFLQHASHAMTGDATAKIEISILDEASKPTYSQTTAEYRFTGDGQGWGWMNFIKHEVVDKENHINDDRLTVLCDVTVSAELQTEDHVEVAAPEPTIVVPVAPPFDLRGQLAEAIWNKQPVDVRIKVAGETFPAHRWVLEAGSHVFKTELSVASMAAGTAELRVQDMDAEVFKALLQFMYTDSPPLLDAAPVAEKVLVASDRYVMEKLKLICEKALCQHIDMSSVAATLALAERHRCSMLSAACIQFLSSNGNLEAFMAADGFKQLKTSWPSALVELVAKRVARQEH